MEETKLNRLLTNLRTDVDMLLNNHYNQSDKGVAGMKQNIANLISKVKDIRDELDTTTQQTMQTAVGFVSFKGQYTSIIENTETKANRVYDYFVEFLGYFLSEAQKLEQVDIFDRMEVVGPIITNLRDHLENFTNAVQSSDFEALSTQVEDLETSYETLQTQYNTLQNKVNQYLTPPDPYYIGKSFTDYPAGTIWQTYDCDERIYNFQNTQIITTPTLHFTTEQSSTGQIKLTQKFSVNDAVTVTIKVYLNQTLLSEKTFSTQANTEHTYEFELFDCNFNQESTANNIYSTFTYTSTGKTITLTYQKVEITAPNARFLNKICPFNAFYFDGMYYLTDCTGGTLKTAQIEANEMHNMDNLTWTETNIPAVECVMGGSYTFDSDNTAHEDKVHYFRRGLDNLIYSGDISEGISTLQKYVSQLDSITYRNTSVSLSVKSTDVSKCYYSFYNPSTKTINNLIARQNDNDGISCSGAKSYQDTHYTTLSFCMIQNNQGQNTIGAVNTASRFSVLDGINSTMIAYDFKSDYKYKLRMYIKHKDKLVMQVVNKTDTNAYELLSTTELGTYDKYFEMPYDDYFAVVNKQLFYYKKNSQ